MAPHTKNDRTIEGEYRERSEQAGGVALAPGSSIRAADHAAAASGPTMKRSTTLTKGRTMGNPAFDGAPWQMSEARVWVEAKSRRLADSLREAEASPDPKAQNYIDHIERRRITLRDVWIHAYDENWWRTASKLDIVRAFNAASEMAACDPEAAAAAQVINGRIDLESSS